MGYAHAVSQATLAKNREIKPANIDFSVRDELQNAETDLAIIGSSLLGAVTIPFLRNEQLHQWGEWLDSHVGQEDRDRSTIDTTKRTETKTSSASPSTFLEAVIRPTCRVPALLLSVVMMPAAVGVGFLAFTIGVSTGFFTGIRGGSSGNLITSGLAGGIGDSHLATAMHHAIKGDNPSMARSITASVLGFTGGGVLNALRGGLRGGADMIGGAFRICIDSALWFTPDRQLN